jgi:hypothetical protein
LAKFAKWVGSLEVQALKILLCVWVLALAGCGFIVTGMEVVNAKVAILSAETAGAKVHAVYEYQVARAYLDKAKEETAYAEYWSAKKFAEKALDYAIRARRRAEAMSVVEQPMME